MTSRAMMCQASIHRCQHNVKIHQDTVKLCQYNVKMCQDRVNVCQYSVRMMSTCVRMCQECVKICHDSVKMRQDGINVCQDGVDMGCHAKRLASSAWPNLNPDCPRLMSSPTALGGMPSGPCTGGARSNCGWPRCLSWTDFRG